MGLDSVVDSNWAGNVVVGFSECVCLTAYVEVLAPESSGSMDSEVGGTVVYLGCVAVEVVVAFLGSSGSGAVWCEQAEDFVVIEGFVVHEVVVVVVAARTVVAYNVVVKAGLEEDKGALH